MQTLKALETAYDPWPLRRQRTDELLARYAFAGQILTLYRALLIVQEQIFHASNSLPRSRARFGEGVEEFVATQALPQVVDVTVQFGPSLLVEQTIGVFARADLQDLIRRWLTGDSLTPTETYLARASAGPVLEAMGPSGLFPPPLDERHCPNCGGLPQLSYFAVSGEALVTGPRYLLCSRCSNSWIYTRMVCAGCGETSGRRLPIYGEAERFPHVRIDGCESCHQYLLTFDLRKDTRAVPIVDELAALPLDLYAQERGMTKIVPNLVGN